VKDYACYLFDADGTLIDTTELIYECFKYTCKRFGGFEVERDRVVALIGLPLRKQIENYLGPLDEAKAEEVSQAHMAFQMSIYERHLKLFPSVSEGLSLLKNAGKKLAVVTSRRQRTLRLYLDKMGILGYFDALVTPEMTERHKPDPQPALKALELLDCAAGEALFVGDASYDIECGAAAGTDTAFVAWSANSRNSLNTAPTYVIHDLRDLVVR
jgi:pyrophosphatase PpaX